MRKQRQYNVGIYERLSREDEREGDSVSIQTQDQILRKHVLEQGWNLVDVYVDDGYTGGNFKRPALERMIQDTKSGRINLILVKDLSRFGRNYIEFGQYTDYLFPSIGCRFIALHDGVDTIRDDNEIMPFKNLFNEYYLRDCSKKAKHAKRSMAERGKFIGSYAPYGYKLSGDDQRTLLIDHAVADTVRRIFHMRAQGIGARTIASALNGEGILPPSAYRGVYTKPQTGTLKWNGNTVAAIYSNEVYIGNLVSRKTETLSYKSNIRIDRDEEDMVRFENTHEPLIDRDTWEACVRVMQRNSRSRAAKTGESRLFSGLLHCADCGYILTSQADAARSGKRYYYYRCGRYSSGGKGACTSHGISERILSGLVLDDLHEQLAGASEMSDTEISRMIMKSRRKSIDESMAADQEQARALRSRLDELEKVICSLYEDKALGRIPAQTYFAMSDKYQAEQAAKKAQLRQLEERLAQTQGEEECALRFLGLAKQYLNAEVLTREMACRLIDKVVVGEKTLVDGQKNQDIDIYYRFVGRIT
ncbi:MAG: recombinase family protein [Firmicutes bacterium]|nr:recombinase family protein [Bacillota bacterium]